MSKKIIRKLALIVAIIFLTGRMVVPVGVVMALPERPSVPDTTDLPEVPKVPDNYVADPTPVPTPKAVAEITVGTSEENNQHSTDPGISGVVSDGQVGEVEIETGDINAAGLIVNSGNLNVSSKSGGGAESKSEAAGGVTISNQNNGSESENSGSASLVETKETLQVNDAKLNNSLEIGANSGDNSASKNVGGSKITTGGANVSGVIVNSVNTNVDGVLVGEFNVMDDYKGDLILDFSEGAVIDLNNTNNGSESENEAELTMVNSEMTFQSNSAEVENEMILEANTGGNRADNNTGGDSEIKTGDANIAATVINFLNNNFAGEVIYGVVNIFGDLVGDIIVPEKYLSALGLVNSGNGSGSVNGATAELANIDEYSQFNKAEIINNIDLAATTGGNTTSDNTGGDNYIATGDVEVDVNVLNIANNNVIGGNWWLVFVNEAGNWVGKIFGLPGSVIGTNYAASDGTKFLSEGNAVNVSNEGNGTDSQNSGVVSQTNEKTITQENDAKVMNNISLSANTGGNSASRNTGGDNKIETGDASITLNLVNFVNNNFIGGRVFVTVVNVFGSWIGDLIGPGASKNEAVASGESEDNGQAGVGGVGEIPGVNSNISNGSNSGSSSGGDGGGSSSSGGGSGLLALNLIPRVSSYAEQSGGEEEVAVAEEEQGQVLGVQAERAKRRINLAWGLLIIPGYLVFWGGKKLGILGRLASVLRRR